MEWAPLFFFLVIFFALLFSFSNGFNDSANQVATVISSHALAPEWAFIIAALSDFIGAYFLGTHVAMTIAKEIVHLDWISSNGTGLLILFSALTGSLCWNFMSARLGFPSSSFHALIGGLLGSFVVGFGWRSVQWLNVTHIILIMLVSPCIGFVFTYIFTKATFYFGQWLPPKTNDLFKFLQIVTLIFQSFAHGSNDAQKSMGVIVLAFMIRGSVFNHSVNFEIIPQWIILTCSLAMSFGVFVGGWRLIKTLGAGLYRVRTIHGFASQFSSAGILSIASIWGFPISSTQVISASILGAGAAFRPKAVRWLVARDITVAWLITIPISACISALVLKLFSSILNVK